VYVNVGRTRQLTAYVRRVCLCSLSAAHSQGRRAADAADADDDNWDSDDSFQD